MLGTKKTGLGEREEPPPGEKKKIADESLFFLFKIMDRDLIMTDDFYFIATHSMTFTYFFFL